MEKIRPSERIGKEISKLLSDGVGEDQDVLSQLVRKSVRKLVQEVEDYLGRGYYECGGGKRKVGNRDRSK